MADGWLFRLRSTLGAGHAVPAWPASPQTGGEPWPDLRVRAAERDPESSADADPAPFDDA